MDVSTAKTRFFQRDSEKADNSLFIAQGAGVLAGSRRGPCSSRSRRTSRPRSAMTAARCRSSTFSGTRSRPTTRSALGWTSPEGTHRGAASHVRGRRGGIVDASRSCATRSLSAWRSSWRSARRTPAKHRVIWHDLEAERHALEKALPEAVSVYRAQDLDTREGASSTSPRPRRRDDRQARDAWSGCSFQHHCAEAVVFGRRMQFNDFIQAVHRVYRFLQRDRVTIHIIYTEAQREIRRALQKWAQHKELVVADDGHRP